MNIKQQAQVTCLVCVLDKSISGKSMAINKINGKLKFLYSKNKLLILDLCRRLCNAPIQASLTMRVQLSTYMLPKKQRNKRQIMENKCIRFCLR